MRKFGKIIGGVSLGLGVAMATAGSSNWDAAAQGFTFTPQFNDKGELLLPKQDVWREWVYIGTPLTPNALNNGEAPFPEFHSVYIDPVSWLYWKKTGKFREGTVLAKELSLVYSEDAEKDGSTEQVSGRGYFMGELSGFEITIKSKKLFPKDAGNWAYFTFGHHAPPYNKTAKKQPTDACNACHEASASDDFVFAQFYPMLRAAHPKKTK